MRNRDEPRVDDVVPHHAQEREQPAQGDGLAHERAFVPAYGAHLLQEPDDVPTSTSPASLSPSQRQKMRRSPTYPRRLRLPALGFPTGIERDSFGKPHNEKPSDLSRLVSRPGGSDGMADGTPKPAISRMAFGIPSPRNSVANLRTAFRPRAGHGLGLSYISIPWTAHRVNAGDVPLGMELSAHALIKYKYPLFLPFYAKMGLDMRKFEYREFIFAKMGNHAPTWRRCRPSGKRAGRL